LDRGAIGAVLSNTWVRNTQLPYIRRETSPPISDASENHIAASGLHYSKTVDIPIGDHTNNMRFELADMSPGHLDGYFPMAWLKDHNPDIN